MAEVLTFNSTSLLNYKAKVKQKGTQYAMPSQTL